MPTNPYVAAWQLMRRHQRDAEGVLARIGRLAAPLLAAVVLGPLSWRVFFGFLDAGPDHYAAGAKGLVQRAGLLVVAALSVDVYTALIRGPDRAVLDLLPVDAARVVSYSVRRVASERVWVVPLVAWLLLPLAIEADLSLWVTAVVALAGAWVLGLTAAAMVHLLAVDVAESPGWAPVLDALRGANPRQQAAFIYAPGVVLAAAGGIVLVAAAGVGVVRAQPVLGAVLVSAPFVAAWGAWRLVPDLARRHWFRASSVLSDIDARYAAFESPDEALWVYLEWLVRFLPTGCAVWALKDLRHGWRSRRTWITGAWIAGIVAAVAGWSTDADAPGRAMAIVAGGVWWFGAVGALLDRDDPPFLSSWLPRSGAARAGARWIVGFMWLQGVLWPPAVALALVHGIAPAVRGLGVGEASAAAAAAVATACSRWPDQAVGIYVPAAAVIAAFTAVILIGGLP